MENMAQLCECEAVSENGSLLMDMHRLTEEINQIRAISDEMGLVLFDYKIDCSESEVKPQCIQDELRINLSKLSNIRCKMDLMLKGIIK